MGRYGPAGAMSPAVQHFGISDRRRRLDPGICVRLLQFGTIVVQPAWYSTMEFPMADKISTAEGERRRKQVLQRRHDAGSGANKPTDGLDATTENIEQAKTTRRPVPRRRMLRPITVLLILR